MNKKSVMRKIIVIALAFAVLMMPMSAFASSNPYKDVTKKTVGKHGVKVVKYEKKHGIYKDVVKGKKFHPKWKIKRGEFIIWLVNAYGEDKVPITEADIEKWDKNIDPRYATKKMVAVAHEIGIEIIWEDCSDKPLTRILAAKYLYNFIMFDPAFRPRY